MIKNHRANVLDEKKRRVEFLGHDIVLTAMERQMAMLRKNETDGSLPSQNGTPHNLQTCWRCKGTGAPPPDQMRQLTTEPTALSPGTPPVPPGHNDGAHASELEGMSPRNVYIYTPLLSAQFFDLDASAKYRNRNKDFNPDVLTDKGTSTG